MTQGIIYHITERQSWQVAQAAGAYVAESLATQGFIHASAREQVVGTANLLFANRSDLVLLRIDVPRLAAPLKWEAASDAGHTGAEVTFPHIYGALNLDAVTEVVDFPYGPDGRFELPRTLAE